MRIEDFEKHLKEQGCYYYRPNVTVHYFEDEEYRGFFYGNYKGEETEDFASFQELLDAHSWVAIPESIMEESFPMMRNLPEIHTHEFLWEGIPITVTHKPKYVASYDHIEVRAKERIPITGTGYRSIFTTEAEIAEAGGILKMVKHLLDEEAESEEWKEYRLNSRQESLF